MTVQANEERQRLIRVVLQQPALPKYRVPVFRELATREGIQLKVIYGSSAGGPPNAEPDGFDAQCIPDRHMRIGGRTLFWHGPQVQSARRGVADVLVLAWSMPYVSLTPALLRAKVNGVPTVLWGHGFSKQDAPLRSWFRRKVTDLATALLFYSQTAADQFIAAGVERERVFIARNSLDQAPIQQARMHWLNRPAELEAFRKHHRLAGHDVILFVSRLEPANRLDLLLDALAKLKRSRPNVRAVLVGKGEDEPRLRKLAQQLAIEDDVIFPGAIYDEMQLAPWFLCAKLFGYPSNIGLSMLHALGYGLPVVTSDRPLAHGPEIEALQDGHNGLLYGDGNAESFAQAMAKVLDDPALASALSQAALATATGTYSLSSMVDGMERAIRFAAASCQRK